MWISGLNDGHCTLNKFEKSGSVIENGNVNPGNEGNEKVNPEFDPEP